MKIIHVIFNMTVGGSEAMLVEILNEQISSSHDVKLIIINDNLNAELIEKISPRVQIIKLGRRKGYNSLWVGMRLNLLMLKERPSVIHFHDHKAINFFLDKRRYNTILTVHNVGLDSENWHKYTSLAAISRTVQEEIFHREGIKAELIYNGVDLASIRRKEAKQNNYKIVQVGRLFKEKNGQDILLKALSILQRKYPEIPLSLDIIGEGESLLYLKELSSNLGLERVTFLGLKNRDYIYEKLADYDLLVQPSLYEGFGLVIAEALGANIQVLVSNIGAPEEVIKGGQYGTTFKVGDPEDCADKIEKILIKGEFKNLKGLNEYLAQDFDIQATARKYIALYEKLSKEKR